MISNLIRRIIKSTLAVLIAFILVNGCMFFYERTAGWIDITGGSTDSIWMPRTLIIHNTEGHGIYSADKKGYLNSGELQSSNYILAVGASHTQGKEVSNGFRYTDLLNSYYGFDKKEKKVYNLSQDAYFFPDIIRNFKAILSEFPNSSAIIIELMKTVETPEDLTKALKQRKYDELNNGQRTSENLSRKKKFTIAIKEEIPILSIVKKQVETAFKKEEDVEQDKIDMQKYNNALEKCLRLIRSEYNGKLIIIYHPEISICETGMEIRNDDTANIFEEQCKKQNIIFLNLGGIFMKHYKSDYSVPYGFMNTMIGSGHLNKTGHKIIADELFNLLKEAGVE